MQPMTSSGLFAQKSGPCIRICASFAPDFSPRSTNASLLQQWSKWCKKSACLSKNLPRSEPQAPRISQQILQLPRLCRPNQVNFLQNRVDRVTSHVQFKWRRRAPKAVGLLRRLRALSNRPRWPAFFYSCLKMTRWQSGWLVSKLWVALEKFATIFAQNASTFSSICSMMKSMKLELQLYMEFKGLTKYWLSMTTRSKLSCSIWMKTTQG